MDELYDRSNLSDVLINMSKTMNEDDFIKWADNFFNGFIKQKESIAKEKEDHETHKLLLKKQEEEQIKLKDEERNKEGYNETIQFVNGYKVIHRIPKMSEDERERKKKTILYEVYECLSKSS